MKSAQKKEKKKITVVIASIDTAKEKIHYTKAVAVALTQESQLMKYFYPNSYLIFMDTVLLTGIVRI